MLAESFLQRFDVFDDEHRHRCALVVKVLPLSRRIISDVTLPRASSPLTLPALVVRAKRTRSEGVEWNAVPRAARVILLSGLELAGKTMLAKFSGG